MKPSDSILTQIRDLLDTERQLLLSGDLGGLAPLVPQKEALLQTLSETSLSNAEDLKPVHAAAIRNQALLDSTMRGISSVATRLATIRRVRETMQSYDASGTRKSVQIEKGTKLQKRA